MFCKNDVLRNFPKFTAKHLCQSLFFNKVADLRLLLKKKLWHRCFPVNFGKSLRTPFLTEHLWWLLLSTVHTIILKFHALSRINGYYWIKKENSFHIKVFLSLFCSFYSQPHKQFWFSKIIKFLQSAYAFNAFWF